MTDSEFDRLSGAELPMTIWPLLTHPPVDLAAHVRIAEADVARFVRLFRAVWDALPTEIHAKVGPRLPTAIVLRPATSDFWRMDPVAKTPRVDWAVVDFFANGTVAMAFSPMPWRRCPTRSCAP